MSRSEIRQEIPDPSNLQGRGQFSKSASQDSSRRSREPTAWSNRSPRAAIRLLTTHCSLLTALSETSE
jgi:hypothetical protein